jgi:sugar lactone lactonase YvrE
MLKRFSLSFMAQTVWVIFLLAIAPAAGLVLQAPVSVLLQINRVAGSPSGAAGSSGDAGPALSGLLSQPECVTADGAGNLYIADTANNRIRRIDVATATITTVAGNGQQGNSGDNGPAINAMLNQPAGVLADPHGNLYIADTGNRTVRMVNVTTGFITAVAGTPSVMPFNPAKLGDGGPALIAELDVPTSVALDTAGNLYIADSGDNRVREVSRTTQTITTVAGDGAAAYAGDNGSAKLASLNQPTGVGLDAANNIYIADSANSLIRKVNSVTGIITAVAGVPNSSGYNGDGVAGNTQLNFPTGISVDMAGQVYFSDRANNRIRELNAAGNIVTLAGNGTPGLTGDGQLASAATVSAPGGVTIDPDGNLYFADSGNSDLRLISNGLGFPAAPIATITPVSRRLFLVLNQAATLTAPTVTAGENNQPEFPVFTGLGCATDGSTINPSGSICTVPVNFVPGYPGIRTGGLKLTANNTTVSVGLYGNGLGPETVLVPGIINTSIPLGSVVVGGVPLTAPGQIATDSAGNIYVADPGTNQVVRQDVITAALTIVAGNGPLAPAQADGGPATDAHLNGPTAVALDAAENLYIAEAGANRVRKVNLGTGTITTVAGSGTSEILATTVQLPARN